MSDTQPKGAIARGSLPGMRELINVMMQPKEQLIETIKKALEAATPGTLYAKEDEWPGNSNLKYWVETHEDGIGCFVRIEDAYLAANAPEWIRALLEENKRLDGMFDDANHRAAVSKVSIDELYFQLQQTREELEQEKFHVANLELGQLSLSTANDELKYELEQVKAELENLKGEDTPDTPK